jgi:hypothetical protein
MRLRRFSRLVVSPLAATVSLLGFFVDNQFLDLLTLRRIASDFDQFLIVCNVLLYDKTLHRSLRLGS